MRNLTTPSQFSQPPPLPIPSTVPKISICQNTPARKSSLPIPTGSSARAASALASRKPVATFKAPSQPTPTAARRSDAPQPTDGNEADSESPSHHKSRSRPPSALAAGGRRSSMLPTRPRGMSKDGTAVPGTQEDRPKWRP
jgi:hypothetical protein